MKKKRVVIVGGGISGLACALRVREIAQQRKLDIELTLIEAARRPGGVIASLRRENCLLELGPDAIFTEKPWGIDFCRKIGLEKEIIGTNPDCRTSFIALGGKLHPVPEGFYLLAPSRIRPLLGTSIFTLRGKLRALAEPFIPRRREDGDESLASFVRRRLGQEVLERMAQPMVGGIYSADPEELSLEATFPRFLEMERKYGSVIRGMFARRLRSPAEAAARGPRYSLFVSLRNGLRQMVEQAAAKLPPESLRTGMRVAAVEPGTGGGFTLRGSGFKLDADSLCLALPAHASASLIRPLDAPLAETLSRIEYHSGATLNFIYRSSDIPRPLNGFGCVVPAIEKRAVSGVTFNSVKFPGRSPQDRTIFRAFLGGKDCAAILMRGDEEVRLQAQSDIEEILGFRAAPLFSHLERHPLSLPQYKVGHLSLLRKIEARLKSRPGLALAGNGYAGTGVPDCIRSGEKAAERVLPAAYS